MYNDIYLDLKFNTACFRRFCSVVLPLRQNNCKY